MNVQWYLKDKNYVNTHLNNSFMVEKYTVIFDVALYMAPGVLKALEAFNIVLSILLSVYGSVDLFFVMHIVLLVFFIWPQLFVSQKK